METRHTLLIVFLASLNKQHAFLILFTLNLQYATVTVTLDACFTINMLLKF